MNRKLKGKQSLIKCKTFIKTSMEWFSTCSVLSLIFTKQLSSDGYFLRCVFDLILKSAFMINRRLSLAIDSSVSSCKKLAFLAFCMANRPQ